MKTSLRNPFRRAYLLFAVLFASVAGLYAQPQEATEPALQIGTIDVKFVGAANVSEQVVRANMALREGTVLDESLIDRDIRSLYRTGLFEFIEVKREARPSNTVNLLIEVTPKYRVLSVIFQGNKAYKEKRLSREAKTVPNSTLDERQIKEDSEKIYQYYQKNGYNQAQVTYTIDRNRSTGFGTVTFKIREGAKVRISDIKFVGNTKTKARKLRKEMETKKWHLFSWISGGGRFIDSDFDEDLEKLRDYYRELGYLDVEITEDKVNFNYVSAGRLVITVNINEGRQYHIGDVMFSGNKIHPSRLLRLVVRQRKGMVFIPSKLDKDVENIEDFYGRDGYLDTRARLIRKPNLETGNIDIEYQINESEKFQVESINIEGNTKTKSIVVLRELVLGPGDVFDSVRMKISKMRLENTRFFEDVNVTPESTNIPGRRNLRVALREARTGNLTFGAGFSSLERAVIFTEITQSNFDLFNRKSFFQGDGQKFRLRMQLGSESSEVVLAFEEPWLFERELALGFQLFRTTSDYNSAFYNEIRSGGQIYLRKRLFGLVEGTLTYTFEIVDIANVDPTAPASIQSIAGQTTISKLGFSLLRDTRDKIVNTTRGNRMELITEIAGGPLSGDVNYYRVELRGSQFYPVFEFQEQVLSLIARAGVVQNFGKSNSVPFFDQYFLGGPQTLRGFEFREVGPKNAFGEPEGGRTYGFFSAEYSIDLVKPIRFALFYDAGFVNRDAYDFSPAEFNDNFGFGLRLFVAGAPLSLDFGIPLHGDRFNKKGSQFNFSFGTRF
ncbi:MAG: outer membrane protein assembly factor BamA [Candidatus Didemnitutus sp.]|nr:outer membrane protein assembly factor BamA [Candidatus Didemnitutus sp.]